ncbi:MAG: bifunctional folylpolyglutamate synthase/dihydrofolate synthase [Lachnospiraceae bacterium]|nr:bifunctional folylpolyglutamate synthase/dihydrofolate synthase [Lachnospiraceae bacterium]
MKVMKYDEALEYIGRIPWTSRSVGLHRIKALLKALGRPDRKLKFIHVAGTNGKGSVCSMLDSVLRAAGYRVGLFTSPHLLRYNERMKVDGCDIGDDEFAKVISEVKEASEKLEAPSEFEVLTAAGMLWFARKKCDIVILEVGLGGEFDSTNVIENKELAVITPIGYDHTGILGNTLGEIATAKAGIITEGCDVVCSLQSREGLIANEYPLREDLARKMEILKVIGARCSEKKALLHIPDTFGFRALSKDIDGQVFKSRYYDEPLRLNLIGEYQLLNALTVLEAVRVLNKRSKKANGYVNKKTKKTGFFIDEEAVRKGLESVTWAARFEVLHRDPVFILDGAHNDHGIDAAVDSLRWVYGDKKIIYILGILSDKNIDSMLLKLYSNAKWFITLTPESSRALAGEKLAERLRGAGFEAINFDSPKEAVEYALKNANEKDDVICSLGSLYLAGHVRECFK